jgi:tetratricopeptide (TPR) repeat protein
MTGRGGKNATGGASVPTLAWGTAAAIAAGAFLLYARAAGNGFVTLDDGDYVVSNPRVAAGLSWDGILWAFGTFHGSNWHPLTWLSHMLDVEGFGLAPGPHHLMSAAIHAASAALLFLFWRSATRAWGASAFVAALFAAHPLRVESVAWAAERKDVLSGLFWMLTLIAYGEYARRGGTARFLAALCAFAAGLLAKPMLVTLPFVLLLLDAWPLGRLADRSRLRRAVMEKLPFLALAAASSAVTLAAQASGGAMGTLETIPLSARLANAAASYLWYLGKTFWPSGLGVYYPHPALVEPGLRGRLLVMGIAAAAVLAAATVIALRSRRERPHVAVGWLWFVGTLVPVIGVVQVGMQARADRYAYLPLIGIYVAVAWEAARFVERRPGAGKLVATAAAASLAALSTATFLQIGHWRDSLTLYRHTLAVTSRNFLVHTNLGSVLEKEGRLNEAEAQYLAAIAAKPDFVLAHFNHGVLLARKGDAAAARARYEEALRLQPEAPEARSNLASALRSLGDDEGAERELRACLVRDPAFVPALYNLGILLSARGDAAGAADAFERVVREKPGYSDASYRLGVALERLGKIDEAVRRYEEVVRLRPDDRPAWYDLGVATLKRRDFERARAAFEQTLLLDPAHARAHYALASILVHDGRLVEAARHYEEAFRLDPALTAARDDLEKVRTALGLKTSP